MAFIYSPRHIFILCELQLSPAAHRRLMEKFKSYQYPNLGLSWFLKELLPMPEIRKVSLFNRTIQVRVDLTRITIEQLDVFLARVRKKLEEYTE